MSHNGTSGELLPVPCTDTVLLKYNMGGTGTGTGPCDFGVQYR
jgi:hypothetical protein